MLADSLAVAERGGAQAVRVEANDGGSRLVVRVEHDAQRNDPRTAALLEDRVAVLGGRLRIEQTPAGGTVVLAELPCA